MLDLKQKQKKKFPWIWLARDIFLLLLKLSAIGSVIYHQLWITSFWKFVTFSVKFNFWRFYLLFNFGELTVLN